MTKAERAFEPVSPAVLSLFQSARRILLLTHHNPDGDALGSSAGLARALQNQGRTVHLYLTGSHQANLNFLIEDLTILEEVKSAEQYNLAVLLDCHGFDRLGAVEGPALKEVLDAPDRPLPLVVIDHHLLSEGGTVPRTWVWDPAASSTGELVVRLLKALAWPCSEETAEALLSAIASDTGFFSQTNATAGSLRAAADLVAAGGSLERVDRRIRRDWHPRRLRLMGLVLSSLETHFDGRVAVMTVTPAMLEAAGAEMSDTEDLVDMGRGLAGVRLAALIKDSGGGRGTVRVSLRSRDEIDARALAKTFGGGGHRQASAYNDHGAADAEAVKARFLAEAGKHFRGEGLYS